MENLPNNRQQAIIREKSLKYQFDKNPEVKKLFHDQIKIMISNSILKSVDNNYPKRYLPLLAVTDLNRESTKVRVCLDAKSKFQVLYKGKLNMPDILKVLTLFRVGKYALIGDIQKMFWQIKLYDEDQKCHGVVWEGKTYVFTRVCFGNKPSPPIADECMLKIAHEGKESHPGASFILTHKRYMDDLINSGSDEQGMPHDRKECDELLGRFGFKIKTWYSNNPLIGYIVETKKVLGIIWNVQNDTLHINVEQNVRYCQLLLKYGIHMVCVLG